MDYMSRKTKTIHSPPHRPFARRRITEVIPCGSACVRLRGKMSARYSVRRRYETSCCFPAAGGLKPCCRDSGQRPAHQSRGKCSPVPQGDQAASKNAEQGQQETAKGHEESREGTAQANEEGESPPGFSLAVCQNWHLLGFQQLLVGSDQR